MTLANEATSSPPSRGAALAWAIIPVLALGGLAPLVTLPSIPGWYLSLTKPAWTPPNWLFGPAWTVLYGLMALACFRLLRAPASPTRRWALTAYAVQLALNALWSPIFFGLHAPAPALLVISSLFPAIAITGLLSWRVDRVAAWCFAPYIAWVAFAAALNTAIVALNP